MVSDRLAMNYNAATASFQFQCEKYFSETVPETYQFAKKCEVYTQDVCLASCGIDDILRHKETKVHADKVR